MHGRSNGGEHSERARPGVVAVALAVGLIATLGACGGGTVEAGQAVVLPSGSVAPTGPADGGGSSSTTATTRPDRVTTGSAPARGKVRKLEATGDDEPDPEPEPETDPETDPEVDPEDATDPEDVAAEEAPGTIRQWGSWAEASSSYGTEPGASWNASQATGAPDVDPECRDDGKAWASVTRDEVATLTVHFDEAVHVSEVDIYQTYNPGQIVQIDLLSPTGEVLTIYEGEPAESDSCPVQGYLRDLEVEHPVIAVAVTVDQSVLGVGWAEIDAVELVGVPIGWTG